MMLIYREDGTAERLDQERVEHIAALAGVSVDYAEHFIGADWDEGDEHIDWLLTAGDEEIASWVKAGIS